MTRSLLATGKHAVTALTRADSKSTLPSGVTTKQIDYEDHASIVTALQGQDALVITLSTFAPPGQQEKLLKAAADAKVPWILPNEWSPDSQHEGLVKDVYPFYHLPEARAKIEELGQSSWIAVTCGFWYEWSLAIPAAFGIDLARKEATLFDVSQSLSPALPGITDNTFSAAIEGRDQDDRLDLATSRSRSRRSAQPADQARGCQ